MLQPQEIEVLYIIPAIRRELAKALIKVNLSQKAVAQILGITPAAISQYISEKRAKEVKFNEAFQKLIEESAKKIAQNHYLVIQEINELCHDFRKSDLICQVHKQLDVFDNKICDYCKR